MLTPFKFVGHSLSCGYRDINTDEKMFDLYHTGQTLIASHPQCTNTQSTIGVVMAGLILAVVIFTLFTFIAANPDNDKWDRDHWLYTGVMAGIMSLFIGGPVVLFILGHFLTVLIVLLSITAFIFYLIGTYRFMKMVRRKNLSATINQFFQLISVNRRLMSQRKQMEQELMELGRKLMEQKSSQEL